MVKSGILAAAFVLFGAFTASAQERTLVLDGGTLIDGTGRAPITNAVVVVKGDRITAVGTRGQVQIPAGATVIKTDGRTILPGLVDTHVHLRDWHIPFFLAYGVTTIGDIHNDTKWSLAQRELLKSGKMQGPRLFVSGARVSGLGGPAMQDPSYVKDVPEARAYIRYLKSVGADQVKVDRTITDEQLGAVLDEANKQGLRVFGHTRNIKVAIDLGMKHMEHTDTMARALLEQEGKNPEPKDTTPESLLNPALMPALIDYEVKQQVFVDPTLYIVWWSATDRWHDTVKAAEQLAKDPNLAFVPDAMKTRWTTPPKATRPGFDNVVKFLTQFSAAGGKILVGSDANENQVVPGLASHVEMQMMTDMGIPAMKAIQGATLFGAEMMGRQKDYGSVEVGKMADFVVIEGDPLKDITATRNIKTVIMGGKVMDTKFDPKWKNPLPRPAVVAVPG